MAKGLTTKKISELLTTFIETGSVDKTARICGVHHTTVKRYAEKNAWKEIRAQKLIETQEKVADQFPDRVVDALIDIQIYKDYINILRDNGELNCSIKDYIELVKLEQLLIGEPDSRPDTPAPQLWNFNLNANSENEIDAELAKCFKAIYSGNGSPKDRF